MCEGEWSESGFDYKDHKENLVDMFYILNVVIICQNSLKHTCQSYFSNVKLNRENELIARERE